MTAYPNESEVLIQDGLEYRIVSVFERPVENFNKKVYLVKL